MNCVLGRRPGRIHIVNMRTSLREGQPWLLAWSLDPRLRYRRAHLYEQKKCTRFFEKNKMQRRIDWGLLASELLLKKIDIRSLIIRFAWRPSSFARRQVNIGETSKDFTELCGPEPGRASRARSVRQTFLQRNRLLKMWSRPLLQTFPVSSSDPQSAFRLEAFWAAPDWQ